MPTEQRGGGRNAGANDAGIVEQLRHVSLTDAQRAVIDTGAFSYHSFEHGVDPTINMRHVRRELAGHPLSRSLITCLEALPMSIPQPNPSRRHRVDQIKYHDTLFPQTPYTGPDSAATRGYAAERLVAYETDGWTVSPTPDWCDVYIPPRYEKTREFPHYTYAAPSQDSTDGSDCAAADCMLDIPFNAFLSEITTFADDGQLQATVHAWDNDPGDASDALTNPAVIRAANSPRNVDREYAYPSLPMRTPRTHTIQSACEHDVTVPWAAVTPARYAEVKSCVETRDNGRVGTFKIWRDNHDALVTAPDRDPAAVPVYEFIVTRPTTPSSATIDVDTATEVIARITVHARLVDTFLDQHEAWRATPRPTQSAFAVVSWRELFSFFDIWEDTTPTVIASDNMFGRRYEVDTGIEIYDDDVYADPDAHDLVREARHRHAWHQLVTRRDRVNPTLSYTRPLLST